MKRPAPPAGTLELASLGSGSSGNSLVVRSQSTTLLLDCGLTLKDTLQRLGTLGIEPNDIDAILITHEHVDHVRSVGPLARRFDIPVWMTHGTAVACRDRRLPQLHLFHAHEVFELGDIHLDPFPTPHDAAESCQFVFRVGQRRFACLTDLGASTPHVIEKLNGIDALLLESNYDPDMLRNGPYPRSLQVRIASAWGHLSNVQAAEVLDQLDHNNLQHVFLGHLSERNNTGVVALQTVGDRISDGVRRLTVLQQHVCSEWFRLE